MSKPRKVHTIENLLARTEEEGECRVWTGYSTNKTPQVKNGDRMVSVRRLLVELQGKQVLPKRIFGVYCGTDLCVCPEHITQRSVSHHAKVMAKAASLNKAEQSRIKTIARRSRSDTKLDVQKASEIRSSDESGPVLAERYGVSRSLISSVRRGKSWRDFSNPFLGLGG